MDEGCRLKDNVVNNIANTLHSLTYIFPSYDLDLYGGPKINILFTNISILDEKDEETNILGIEGEDDIRL